MTEILDPERASALLENFRAWLVRLPKDVELLSSVLEGDALASDGKIKLASGLNYLLKSIDLIDDGIAGLGFLDDAFVLRLVVARVPSEVPEALSELRAEADLVLEFLGDLRGRFDAFLISLEETQVRGRTPAEIAEDPAVASEFVSELRSFSQRYECPAFTSEPSSLVKLRAFLNAKLPT